MSPRVESSPEEIAALTKERALSDAEKITQGAEYVVIDSSKEPRLEFTAEQVEEARAEMGESLRERLEKQTPRETIITVLRDYQVEFDEETIGKLEAKLSRYENVRNESALAYTIARNWAIDQWKYKERGERRKQRERNQLADQLLETEQRRKRLEEFNLARGEFWQAAEKIIADNPRSTKLRGMLEQVYAYIFEGASDEVLANEFTDSTADARYQNRHRAKVQISNSEYASPILKKVIWDSEYREFADA